MMIKGLFDWQTRFEQLDNCGDPLVKLQEIVKWEQFRSSLETIRDKERKSNAGRKPFDVILMFKVMILQSLYNLSDDQLEFQIRDRLSFMRFLGLGIGDTVPDAKTIWFFREQLTEAKLIENLFTQFDKFLSESGFSAKKGQIIDASIVAAPKQRNSRDENKAVKQGEIPEDWSENKKRQKDTDARWIKKNGKTYFDTRTISILMLVISLSATLKLRKLLFMTAMFLKIFLIRKTAAGMYGQTLLIAPKKNERLLRKKDFEAEFSVKVIATRNFPISR